MVEEGAKIVENQSSIGARAWGLICRYLTNMSSINSRSSVDKDDIFYIRYSVELIILSLFDIVVSRRPSSDGFCSI